MRIGGFERLKDYLAEDFVMGRFAAQAGFGVILSQEGSGEETRLTVYFDRAGRKKFVARFANLTPA